MIRRIQEIDHSAGIKSDVLIMKILCDCSPYMDLYDH